MLYNACKIYYGYFTYKVINKKPPYLNIFLFFSVICSLLEMRWDTTHISNNECFHTHKCVKTNGNFYDNIACVTRFTNAIKTM